MISQKTVIFFFSLLLTIARAQNCVGSLSDDLIQTGTVDIINPLVNARQTIAQSQILYTIPATGFQTALSFIDFQYNGTTGLDLTLRGGRIGNSNFLGISVLLLQDRKWDKIKISYFVHSRNDVWVGSFTYSTWALNSWQNNSGSLSAQVQGAVDNWTPDNSNTVFLKAVFLSGIQTTLKDFSLSLNNVTFDKVRGIIGVTLGNATKSIQQITITYLITKSPMTRLIWDSFTYTSTGVIPSADYGMIGNAGFSLGFSGPKYYGLTMESVFLNCIGSCQNPCLTKSDCSQANGTLSFNNCFICPANTKYNDTQKACITVCGVNQQFLNGTCQCIAGFIKLGTICVSRCGVNQEWNGNACVCIAGHAKINGACRPCPTNSIPNANKDSCQCQGGSIFDSNTSRCIQSVPCPVNSSAVIENGIYKCKCNSDYFANGDKCTYCPSPAQWNASNLACSCPLNQFFNGTGCISCKQGQFYNPVSKICQCYSPRILVSGECQCPNNLTYNQSTNKCICSGKLQTLFNDKCVCVSPYIRLQSGQCGLVCPQNEWWFGGQCICKQPFVRINSKCTINCTINQRYNGIQCVCVDGYFRVNGTCITCPVNTIYNSTSKTCQNACGLNQIVKDIQCVCKDNFYRINKVCSQCPTGTGYSPLSGFCIACDKNQNTQNSLCVCKVNLYRINGICGQCSATTIYNKINQTCDNPCKVNQIYDGSSCTCATGFNKINGLCSVCPLGSTYNSDTANCVTICKSNEVYNGSTCICISGLNRIKGVCDKCSVGTNYNQSTQNCDILCKVNEVYNGTGCICDTGYILINNVCDKCPSGSYFDDSLRKCVIQPFCPLRSEWNQTKLQCICSVANQFFIDGTCQPCGVNSGWNGTRCVCKSSFYLIGTECLTCDINSSYNQSLKNCVCNRGFYGNRTLCSKCDATCGRCSGSNTNQCLDCVDVSYTFDNGTCSKASPCVQGKYLDGTTCKSCPSYCANCKNQNTCTSCTSGFSLSEVVLGASLTYSYCEQICGDGKRYEYQCDDGNTVNGDGCSDQCKQQIGWTCTGGTTTSKSSCVKFNPSRTILTPKGAVQLSGKVMQGITINYLPQKLTAGECPLCSELILVSVIQAQVIPSFRVNFLPTTQYKFLIQFDFQGIFGIPPFTFTLRINPDYAKYFNSDDMAQLITLTVDPAVLAIGEEVQDLTIEQILGQKIAIADNDVKKVFG